MSTVNDSIDEYRASENLLEIGGNEGVVTFPPNHSNHSFRSDGCEGGDGHNVV